MSQRKALSKYTGILIKSAIFLYIVIFLIIKIRDSNYSWDQAISYGETRLAGNHLKIFVVIVLMPLNWSLEALKWRVLTRPIIHISFEDAFKNVLTGLALSFATPHALGDYAGRILSIEQKQRLKLVGALFLSRSYQLIPTLVVGAWGLFFIFGLVGLVPIVAAPLMVLIIYLLSQLRIKNKWMKKVAYYFNIISSYTGQTHAIIGFLAFLRYAVFFSQFVLVMSIFLPDQSLNTIGAAISWVFFMKSVLPAFNFLSDLGIREFSAVYFFDHLSVDPLPAVMASLLIWLVNILVPTLFGLPLIFKLKWKR